MVALRRLIGRRAYRIGELTFTHLAMIAVVGPFFFIFFYMFWSSVKPDYLFFEPGVWIFEPLLLNYTDVIENSDIIRNIVNSLIISSFATAIGLICGLLSAYTIARFDLRRLALGILVTRMIPYITMLVPFWIVYKNAGLLNTHLGLILSHLVITIPFGVWIMIGFIEDIPKELEEAAWIDGASRAVAFLRVVLPLSTPGMVATAILCFIFSWNNFQLALVLGGFDVSTAPVSVFKYADPESGSMGQMMAAATLVTLPVFVIVLFIQKQLTAGLTVGGIK
ncbi:MAG: carbohydrate ABC transporter permease [SAR324 cluster bacterium]|nr:carbohydrate ABC transporter permease [SAR324 cluster bacterium]